MNVATPFFLIDESRLLKNLEKIQGLSNDSGVKSVLALKCFSTWSVFDLMSQYMDGTTSSSRYEAQLGFEKFGKEVHYYSVAFSDEDICAAQSYANKIIFNSTAQLKRYHSQLEGRELGLRINPQMSYSDYDLADPARKHSRLGVIDFPAILDVADQINGVMFHYNCDNEDFDNFSASLDKISDVYGDLLSQLDWVSLGGGVHFTHPDYPLKAFSQKLKKFGQDFEIQVYLEPGETAISGSTTLVTSVLDIVHNEVDIAIVDSSLEAHLLDFLIYQVPAEIEGTSLGKHHYMIGGKSCLAGDIFGDYHFEHPLKVGDQISFADVGGYSMVKTNWFNGLSMPSIVVKRLNGQHDLVKTFHYQDFEESLGSIKNSGEMR